MQRAALAALAISLAFYFYMSRPSASLSAVRQRHATASYPGRRAVVVGGTSGIGRGIALRLAGANLSVTIVGRDAERGREVVELLMKRGGQGHEFMACDAAVLANVRDCCAELTKKDKAGVVLGTTQGIANTQGRNETSEGLDVKLSLHFYSRMAFIYALLPLLRQAQSPRVLSVLSGGVHSPYAEWRSDPELKTHYSLKNAADAAGFYNDLALDALARAPEDSKIAFIHAAPGFVNTNWVRFNRGEKPFLCSYHTAAGYRDALVHPRPCSRHPAAGHVAGGLRRVHGRPAGTIRCLCVHFLSSPSSHTDPSSIVACYPCFSCHSKMYEISFLTAAVLRLQLSAEPVQTGSVHLMGSRTETAKPTDQHTPEARDFIWQHTLEVLKRTGVAPKV